jgi:hypothetical protein
MTALAAWDLMTPTHVDLEHVIHTCISKVLQIKLHLKSIASKVFFLVPDMTRKAIFTSRSKELAVNNVKMSFYCNEWKQKHGDANMQ